MQYVSQMRRGVKDDATGRDDWVAYEKLPGHIKPGEGELVLEYYNGIPRLKIGDGVREFSALPYMSVDSFILPTPASITLVPEAWQQVLDEDEQPVPNRYYQLVTVNNAIVTRNSKIDLQPSPEQLAIFHEKDLTFTTINRSGSVRVCVVGQKPTQEYTIQATVMDVAEDMYEVIGNTTATPNPRPDWDQVDESKADYIKNKPDYEALVARIEALEKQIQELSTQVKDSNIDI